MYYIMKYAFYLFIMILKTKEQHNIMFKNMYYFDSDPDPNPNVISIGVQAIRVCPIRR